MIPVLPPDRKGQDRGNSGVFLQGLYEVQVLDSYDNPTYVNGEAGAIYKQSAPLVNALKPAPNWQAYDIVYYAPRFYNDGTSGGTGAHHRFPQRRPGAEQFRHHRPDRLSHAAGLQGAWRWADHAPGAQQCGALPEFVGEETLGEEQVAVGERNGLREGHMDTDSWVKMLLRETSNFWRCVQLTWKCPVQGRTGVTARCGAKLKVNEDRASDRRQERWRAQFPSK